LVLRRTEKERKYLCDRLEALESLGDLKNDASSPREWSSYYEMFLASNEDRKARARVLSKAAECWDQVGLADAKKAVELLDEAESISDGKLDVLANVEFQRANIAHNDGKVNSALDHIKRARRFFEEIGDLKEALRCSELEVLILRQADSLQEARELAEKLVPFARSLNDPELTSLSEMLAAFMCGMVGEIELAKKYASGAIVLSSKLGLMWSYGLALQFRAWAFELEGDLESARKDVSLALENALELENPLHVALFEIDLGMYESELGHLESAEFHYGAAKKQVSELGSYARELLESDLSILRAELLWRIGAIERSNELYEDGMRIERERKHPYELMNYCLRYGRTLARRGEYPEAKKCFNEAMGLAREIGCEKRVQIFAKWACIAI